VQSKKKESCKLYLVTETHEALLTPDSIALQLDEHGASFYGIRMVWGYHPFVLIDQQHGIFMNVVDIKISGPHDLTYFPIVSPS
jgi:hypothetical protein